MKHQLSEIINRQLPQTIREQYPGFVDFVKAYYAFLETQNVYRNLETVRDLDKTLDVFVDTLKYELAQEFPDSIKGRNFLKNIGHVNVAHGSEESYRFLFRQLFKKEIDIRYPKDQIAKVSNALWVQDYSIFVKLTSGTITNLENNVVYLNTKVNGKASKNKIYVKRIEAVETTTDIYELFIEKDYYGNVLVGDTISQDGVKATVVPTTTSVKVITPGYGFSIGQVFSIESGVGSGLTIRITDVNALGSIKAAKVIRYGVNYQTSFTFDLASTIILPETTTVTGFNIDSISVLKKYEDGGIVSKQDYYGDTNYYALDYAGTVVGDFNSTTPATELTINNAKLSVQLGTVAKYEGYYANSTGLVSSPDSVIQDNYYYQDYSYVLRIDEAIDTYKEIVLSILHPSGRKMFAEYVIQNTFEIDYEIVEPIFKILLPLFSGQPSNITPLDEHRYDFLKPTLSSVLITEPARYYVFDMIVDPSNTENPFKVSNVNMVSRRGAADDYTYEYQDMNFDFHRGSTLSGSSPLVSTVTMESPVDLGTANFYYKFEQPHQSFVVSLSPTNLGTGDLYHSFDSIKASSVPAVSPSTFGTDDLKYLFEAPKDSSVSAVSPATFGTNNLKYLFEAPKDSSVSAVSPNNLGTNNFFYDFVRPDIESSVTSVSPNNLGTNNFFYSVQTPISSSSTALSDKSLDWAHPESSSVTGETSNINTQLEKWLITDQDTFADTSVYKYVIDKPVSSSAAAGSSPYWDWSNTPASSFSVDTTTVDVARLLSKESSVIMASPTDWGTTLYYSNLMDKSSSVATASSASFNGAYTLSSSYAGFDDVQIKDAGKGLSSTNINSTDNGYLIYNPYGEADYFSDELYQQPNNYF